MNRRWQQRLDLDIPVEPAAKVPVRLREIPSTTSAALPLARQLWAAVQLEQGQNEIPAPHDEKRSATLATLVARAQAFTSQVTVESHDAVLLELAGSRRLFGGMPPLLAALRTTFPRPLQLALAPTPLAAVLLARAGRNCCITSMARLTGRLAPLSLRHLHWPPQEQQRLRDMGIATLGELLRLPRAGLARRLGPDRLRQLDRLTGLQADPRAAIAPAPRFAERADPDHETVDRERLVLALTPALTRLEEFLRERQRGVMALRLTLHYRGAAPQACILRCVAPEYRAARFAALLVARLETLSLPEPVRRMELFAGRLRSFVADSHDLWRAGEHGGSAAAMQAPAFLQTLTARLGEQAVYGLAQVDEHRPERQWRRPAPAAADSPHPDAVPGHRPLGLLRQPMLLQSICDPAGRVRQLLHEGRDLTLVSGPERIESGWWDGGDTVRDYYIARATDGSRWWIFREDDEEGMPRRWFVHGCFA